MDNKCNLNQTKVIMVENERILIRPISTIIANYIELHLPNSLAEKHHKTGYLRPLLEREGFIVDIETEEAYYPSSEEGYMFIELCLRHDSKTLT